MQVDIVIPAYNEEDRIDRTLSVYRSRMDGEARFIVACDGCTDATPQVVERHRREDDRVELLDLPKLGKGGVIREAFRHCDAEFIGFVDADAATPPEEFQRIVDAAARQADGAICSRRLPASIVPGRSSLARRIASAGFAAFIRGLFGLPFSDTQCGAKVFRRNVIEDVLPLLNSRGFEFDVDLLSVARKLGYDIVEVPSIWVDQEGSRVDLSSEAGRMAGTSLLTWAYQRMSGLSESSRSDQRPTGDTNP